MAQGYLNNITFNEYIQYLIDYQVTPEIVFQQLETLCLKDTGGTTWFLPGGEFSDAKHARSLDAFLEGEFSIYMYRWRDFLSVSSSFSPRVLHAELSLYRRREGLPILIRQEKEAPVQCRVVSPLSREDHLKNSVTGSYLFTELCQFQFSDDTLALPVTQRFLTDEQRYQLNGPSLQELLSTLKPTVSTPQLINILTKAMTEKPAEKVMDTEWRLRSVRNTFEPKGNHGPATPPPSHTHSVVDPACSHGMNDYGHQRPQSSQHVVKISDLEFPILRFTKPAEFVRIDMDAILANSDFSTIRALHSQPKGNPVNPAPTLNTATLVKLADPGYAREVEQFTGNTQDDGLKDAIQEALKNERKLQLESAANSIISLLRKADEATEQRVSQLRALRKSEQDKLAELKKVSLARAYGKETNNWIPLCRLVLPFSQWPEVTNEDIVREVPKDWKPAEPATPAAAPADQPKQG